MPPQSPAEAPLGGSAVFVGLLALISLVACGEESADRLTAPPAHFAAAVPGPVFTVTLSGPPGLGVGTCRPANLTGRDVDGNRTKATSGGFTLSNFQAATVTPLLPVTFSARDTLFGSVCGTHNAFVTLKGFLDNVASNTIVMDIGNPVATVRMSPSPAIVKVGATLQLTATPVDSFGTTASRSVSWSSDNPSIISVTQAGVISGVTVGATTIRASILGRSGSVAATTHIAGGTISGPGTISTSGSYSWTANPVPSGNYTYIWNITTYGNSQHLTKTGKTISLTVGQSTGNIYLVAKAYFGGTYVGNLQPKLVGNTIGGGCGGKKC